MANALEWIGAALQLAGLAAMIGTVIAVVQAWRNGVPWWSGGALWYTTSLQPPAARPHIRAAWRRFGLGAALSFAGVLLATVSGGGGAP